MKKATIVIILLSVLYSMHGQQVISTAGGTLQDGSMIVDWTLGEVVTMSLASESMAVTQGYQQPVIAPEFNFSDPCNCADPENVHEGGFVIRFHDIITISNAGGGTVDNQFAIVEVLAGEVLTQDGAPIVGTMTALSTADGDNQVIDLWRTIGPLYKVTIQNLNTGERFEVGAEIDCIPCPQIPSMGAWALFIFFLTLTNIALIKLYKVQFA